MPKKKTDDPYGLDNAFDEPEAEDSSGYAKLAALIINSPRDPRYHRDAKEQAGDTLYAIAQSHGIPFILRALAMMPEDVTGYDHALVSTLGRIADRVELEIRREGYDI
jgi:hypothetical protein